MKVRNMYAYDPETFEYKGLVPTTLDPRASEQAGHDVWMMPVNATAIGPNLAELKEHQVCVYDQVNDKWDIVTDLRGTEIYNAKTKEFTQMRQIGELPAWCYSTDSLPYDRGVMLMLDWTEDGFIIDSARESVIESITRERKFSRNRAAVEPVYVKGLQYKTDATACADYQRIIALDMDVEDWVTVDGTVVTMTPKLAKSLLKMIQERKGKLVNDANNFIKKLQTASSDTLIKCLQQIYAR